MAETIVSSKILEDLKATRKALEDELEKINNAINALAPQPIDIKDWKLKSVECIQKISRCAQTTAILKCMFYPHVSFLENKNARKKYVASLSIALNELCKLKKLNKFTIPGIKGDFYGLTSWFDHTGKPLTEFLSDAVKEIFEKERISL